METRILNCVTSTQVICSHASRRTWLPLRAGRGPRSAPDVAHAPRRTWPTLRPGRGTPLRPGGAAVHSQGRQPLDGQRNVKKSSPGRGDSPAEDTLSPLPGLGRRGMTHSRGSRPGLWTTAPPGRRGGSSRAWKRESSTASLLRQVICSHAPRRTWPPLRAGHGPRSPGHGPRSAPDVAHAPRRTWLTLAPDVAPSLRPGGAAVHSQGRQPLDGQRNVQKSIQPRQGRQSRRGRTVAPAGAGKTRNDAFPGLTPRAMDYRPSGAKRGIIPSMETRIFNCVTSTSSNLFSRSALDIAPASRRTWPPLRAGRGSRSAPDVAHASPRTWQLRFAPEGRRYIARGVSPWTANATSRNPAPAGATVPPRTPCRPCRGWEDAG